MATGTGAAFFGAGAGRRPFLLWVSSSMSSGSLKSSSSSPPSPFAALDGGGAAAAACAAMTSSRTRVKMSFISGRCPVRSRPVAASTAA